MDFGEAGAKFRIVNCDSPGCQFRSQNGGQPFSVVNVMGRRHFCLTPVLGTATGDSLWAKKWGSAVSKVGVSVQKVESGCAKNGARGIQGAPGAMRRTELDEKNQRAAGAAPFVHNPS